MPRIYTVQFDSVSVSAVQDLFGIYSGTAANGKMARLLRVVINNADSTIPASQTLGIQVKTFNKLVVTAGSGGTTPTPQKVDDGDVAATYTAHVNDTTAASTTGDVNIVYDGGFHLYNGFDESFFADGANPKGAQPICIGVAAPATTGSAALIVHLMTAPSAAVHLSGTAWFEEVG